MWKPTRVLVFLVAALGLAWAGSVPAQAAVAVSIQPEAKLRGERRRGRGCGGVVRSGSTRCLRLKCR